MMKLIVRVSSPGPDRPLAQLVTSALGLDVWEAKPDHLVLRAAEVTVDRLKQMGYQVQEIADVESHLQTFATAAAQAGYHSVQTLEENLRALTHSRPEIAELKQIGRSVENRPVWALRIGEREGDPTQKKRVLFMGCHHAREWIAVEVPFLLARELITSADDKDISERLSKGEIWVAPMVNPDGHEFCRTEDRLWRKNRRPNLDGSIGVDPNRNYGYMWGSLGDSWTSSHVPSDDTYVGPYAFSEPETQAIRDLVGSVRFQSVITYHSYQQHVLYPWGFTDQPAYIPDYQLMHDLAKGMSDQIRMVSQKTYIPQQSSKLYKAPVAGDTTDWTYGTYRIPSFTIELRPETIEQGGFLLDASQIAPTWEENRKAAFYLIDSIFQAREMSVFAP